MTEKAKKTDSNGKDVVRLHHLLFNMPDEDICYSAVELLDSCLEVATLNLIAQLTRVSRPTLYRWLDVDIELSGMNAHVAAWFIVMVETNPKMLALLERGQLSRPRMAKRYLDSLDADEKRKH